MSTSETCDDDSTFEVRLSLKGKKETISVSTSTTISDLFLATRQAFRLDDTSSIKLLHKGKVIGAGVSSSSSTCSCNGSKTTTNHFNTPAFQNPPAAMKPVKIMVMVTDAGIVQDLNSKRSDPLLRGFDQEEQTRLRRLQISNNNHWGPQHGGQHKSYKFVRLQECTEQSFGERYTTHSKNANANPPHAFQARHFLEKLASDPGISAIMIERKLVVNTLGEMDPIDDRIMQKTQANGGCLLGYNTNRGLRIDLKLRTEDLTAFRPYHEVVKTLIHELSHNWVSEHDVLFWSNYAQMRVEYLYKHVSLATNSLSLVNGKTLANLAGVEEELEGKWTMEAIARAVTKDVARETVQHGVPVQMIIPSIASRCREFLIAEEEDGKGKAKSGVKMGGQKLGQGDSGSDNAVGRTGHGTGNKSARDLALEAAERRRKSRGDEKE